MWFSYGILNIFKNEMATWSSFGLGISLSHFHLYHNRISHLPLTLTLETKWRHTQITRFLLTNPSLSHSCISNSLHLSQPKQSRETKPFWKSKTEGTWWWLIRAMSMQPWWSWAIANLWGFRVVVVWCSLHPLWFLGVSVSRFESVLFIYTLHESIGRVLYILIELVSCCG